MNSLICFRVRELYIELKVGMLCKNVYKTNRYDLQFIETKLNKNIKDNIPNSTERYILG